MKVLYKIEYRSKSEEGSRYWSIYDHPGYYIFQDTLEEALELKDLILRTVEGNMMGCEFRVVKMEEEVVG